MALSTRKLFSCGRAFMKTRHNGATTYFEVWTCFQRGVEDDAAAGVLISRLNSALFSSSSGGGGADVTASEKSGKPSQE